MDYLPFSRDEYGEDAPELAPILHQYGRALLEHVISTSSALGGGGTVENDESDAVRAGAMKKNDARFSFEGDGDESDEEAVPSLGKRKANDIDHEDNDNQNDEEEDDDDMGVVFSVLDLARVLYGHILDGTSSQVSSSKGKSASRCELKLITGEVWDRKAIETDLAEVRNDLGDVGLETGTCCFTFTPENFEQASTDYEASLNLLKPLLSPYSRRLSDANLRLGLALEFHPDPEQRSRALDYIEQAANVLKRRLVELSNASESKNADSKDQTDDSLSLLDEDQVKRETKDVQELLQDLEVKVRWSPKCVLTHRLMK